jgi:hypothetical protein
METAPEPIPHKPILNGALAPLEPARWLDRIAEDTVRMLVGACAFTSGRAAEDLVGVAVGRWLGRIGLGSWGLGDRRGILLRDTDVALDAITVDVAHETLLAAASGVVEIAAVNAVSLERSALVALFFTTATGVENFVFGAALLGANASAVFVSSEADLTAASRVVHHTSFCTEGRKSATGRFAPTARIKKLIFIRAQILNVDFGCLGSWSVELYRRW